ncbi:hypothetical protein [Streptomyces sp. NPDC048142]|uniref:hypothetical protein n=1 Tax=Streptomyces sp. NPDC048142 TaxID=3365501 RepID=UPI00371A6FC1
MCDPDPDPTNPAGLAPRAYWCERSTYPLLRSGAPDVFVRYSVPTAAEAISRFQSEARALAEAMAPDARGEALERIGGAGRVRAIAALHRGRTCGFSLGHGERWTEWTVRPYLAFPVAARHLLPVLPPSGCPCGSPRGGRGRWCRRR